jgi:hypothetical protein
MDRSIDVAGVERVADSVVLRAHHLDEVGLAPAADVET